MLDNLLPKLSVPIHVNRINHHAKTAKITCRKQVQQCLMVVSTGTEIEPQGVRRRTHRARAW
jgi:hypothetical protein